MNYTVRLRTSTRSGDGLQTASIALSAFTDAHRSIVEVIATSIVPSFPYFAQLFVFPLVRRLE